jgi:pyridoxal phosphate enzyme (YggS family)
MERACQSVSRDPSHVTLVAVSKTQPIEAILAAYEFGQRHFGESRLQESIPKIDNAPDDIIWHFIGSLQSNKVRRITESFDVIHTLAKPAQLIQMGKSALSKPIDVLVEVNIANEAQKTGLSLETLDEFLPMLLQCPLVQFRGLMTIGPALADAEAMRPYFKALRQANERVGGEWLSMGMRNDFEVAIQEGSTHVRIGTALFGAR